MLGIDAARQQSVGDAAESHRQPQRQAQELAVALSSASETAQTHPCASRFRPRRG
jgi:hypothetical protein